MFSVIVNGLCSARISFLQISPALLSAADGTIESVEDAASSSGLDVVLNQALNVIEWSGKILNVMLKNPIYAFLFAVSFIGVGVGVVALFRRAAKG